MLYLFVQVNEDVKSIISERVMSIEPTNNQFFDLFDAIALGQYEYDNREVKVFIRRKKFEDKTALTQNEPDAFNILMENSKQPLLPQHCNEHNNYNKLYNEIIDFFRAQQVGWTGDLHKTIGKEFINRLASALWYIDPHLSTLSAPKTLTPFKLS
ncbi:hypothetical protein C2G38_2170497 [Gigaspora rosea]|uniref:Uncharacterized protein n=1 Tax=Gigaspora rosea TaxID=44941 RepID=A0A397VMJ0_9GLOM|nr:hypothetical protein C2G38_2170497 [Gigaspora rosea]